jgi:hypothetical protein
MPQNFLRLFQQKSLRRIGYGFASVTRRVSEAKRFNKITLNLVDIALSNENSWLSNVGLSPPSHPGGAEFSELGEAHGIAIARRLPCRERSSRYTIIFMDRARPSEYYAARLARRPLGEFCGNEPPNGVGIVERRRSNNWL